MNSLASTQRVRRVFTALAAISGIFLAVGCGGSSSPVVVPPPTGNFSNSSLSGTYVFSTTGSDSTSNEGLLAIAGTFVANGKGGNNGITGGTLDIVGADVAPPSPVAQAISGGSYTVGADGRGQVSLSSAYGTTVFDFVLTSTSHGLVTEFDGHGTGSGTLDLQTAVTSLSQLANPYAFNIAGIDVNGDSLATAGSFTLNSSGAVTAGVQDFNDSGIPYIGTSLTGNGNATLGTGTGPGSISFVSQLGTLTFDFYPIDPTHLKFIETDYTTAILAGDVFSQTGASIPSGPLVFTVAGGITLPIAAGGLMTSDGKGNFSGGLEDLNNDGMLSAAQIPFSGTAGAGGSVGGRVVVSLNGFVPATTWAIYPSSGGLQILEIDTANLTSGTAFAQTATAFAASQGYGLNLSGVNQNGELDDIAQFNATSTNLTGILDENDAGVVLYENVALSGTYTPDSPATGRGSIAVPKVATPLGVLNLEYYVVDASTILFIEGDSNQVALGTFELQSAPGAAAAARAHVSVRRPATRAHAAMQRK